MTDGEIDKGPQRKGLPYWGLILIIIGVFALLDNLKIIPGLNWDIFWPILLIFLGVMAFYEYYQKREDS
jgi:Mg2+ and Co2+ transporter CorA